MPERRRSSNGLALRLQRRTSLAGFLVNAAGAWSLGLYMFVVFPPADTEMLVSQQIGLLAVALYTALAGLTAYRNSLPWFARMDAWLAAGRSPTSEESCEVLRLPARYARMTVVRWAIGMPLFAVPDLAVSREFGIEVAVATTLAGLSATAAVYLATEWVLRPAFALSLARSKPPEAPSLGIGPRLLLTWLLCSGVPILMLGLIPLGRRVTDPDQLIAPILFAAGMAIVTGFVATKLATQAVTRPVRELRRAVEAVTHGDLGAGVAVDDGSEIGRLQAGFNAMVGGLRERERLRDLYGRQVGLDVADAALDGHGGLVNKFEGDAALCVFGAPVAQEDHEARALAAARELRARVDELDGGLRAAIGVASGTVVAGYVGAVTRFEYTIVGDPVNEAARLSEAAKARPERLLASAATLAAAGEEASRWAPAGDLVLRGRRTPTQLAVPATARPLVEL